MPFTGRIGIDRSQLGNIVLGIVDSFELATIGFRAHVLSSNEIRVKFDHAVTNSALNILAYFLSSVDSGAYVPNIDSVQFYDSDQTSVVLKLDNRLTWTKIYSIQINSVIDFDGENVTSIAASFSANVEDPPCAIAAYLGRGGTIDVIFDRDVGPYSIFSNAYIRNTADPPGSGILMSILDWTSENIPLNTVRFSIPIYTPTANSYYIDYINIQDVSANLSTGTIPLSLRLRTSPPYDASSIGQIQFTDAFVVDVSVPINVATIRVFMNVPADSTYTLNQSNWSIYQFGPHIVPDTVNIISSIDSFDLPSVILLLNDAKAQFNKHITELVPHTRIDLDDFINTSDAFDYYSSIDLVNALTRSFLSHIFRKNMHTYNDLVLSPSMSVPHDLTSLISLSNNFKSLYNQHIAEIRSVSFTTVLPPQIGFIVDHASLNNSFSDGGPFRFFVDLNIISHTIVPKFRVYGTIRSEDGGSITDPLYVTGDIIARAAMDEAVEQYHQVNADTGINIFFDKFIEFFNKSNTEIILPSGYKSSEIFPSLTTTLGNIYRAINNLIFSYAYHIGPFGAGHIEPESTYVISPTDYLTSSSLSNMILTINTLKLKYNGHVSGPSHTNPDMIVSASNAIDFNSLVILIDSLQQSFFNHNSSGYEIGPSQTYLGGIVPRFFGYHIYPGPPIMSTKLWTAINVEFAGMINGSVHIVNGPMMSVRFDTLYLRDSAHLFQIQTIFTGIACRPSLASALPRPGLVLRENLSGNLDVSLESDFIEVYFSKPMYKTMLQISDLLISGGSLSMNNMYWKDDRTIFAMVTQMEKIQYSMTAINFIDKAGNLIY